MQNKLTKEQVKNAPEILEQNFSKNKIYNEIVFLLKIFK